MVRYDEESLERAFKSAASLRIKRKDRGDNRYAGDAGYWTGGHCEWGGRHNLSEDCHTLAEALQKIASLKDAGKDLKECTSKEEFDTKKWELSRRAKDAANGLQIRTGTSSSMFGVCIIWADYANFLESKIKPFRADINRFAGQIDKEEYRFVQELKDLELEKTQIEARMKENKRKAQAEKDPDKRAILLQLIEEDGKRLEENLRKQKAIPTNKLNFNPDKYVSDLINAMKEAIEKGDKNNSGGNGNGGGNSGGNKNKDKNGSGGNGGGGGDDDKDPKPPRGKKEEKKEKDNSQMLFIALVVIVIFFLMSNQPKPHREEDYEYYY